MILNINATRVQPETMQFDCMITDPPYSKHVHKNATSQSAKDGARHRELGFDHLSVELRVCIARFAASARKWSVIYTDVEGSHAWREALRDAGATYIRTIPWVRWSMPQLSGDRPAQGFEELIIAWGSDGGAKSWNGPGSLTSLNHETNIEIDWTPPLGHTCMRGDAKHKTEKPLDQCLDLVSWFSDPVDRIFDPCSGSGAVGRACQLLGRDYLGLEIDPDWAERSQARLTSSLSKEERARVETFCKGSYEAVTTGAGPTTERARRRAEDRKRVAL